jgi:hypothetical protein
MATASYTSPGDTINPCRRKVASRGDGRRHRGSKVVRFVRRGAFFWKLGRTSAVGSRLIVCGALMSRVAVVARGAD